MRGWEKVIEYKPILSGDWHRHDFGYVLSRVVSERNKKMWMNDVSWIFLCNNECLIEPCIANKVVAVEKGYIFAGSNLCTKISGEPQVANVGVLDLNPILVRSDGLGGVPRHAVGDDEYLHIDAVSGGEIHSVKHAFDCSASHRPFGMHVYDACNCRH
jgi:hypothetical protein